MKATITFNPQAEATPECVSTLGYLNSLFVGNEGTWVNGDMQARDLPPGGSPIYCVMQNEDESETLIVYENGSHILLFEYRWFAV